MATDTKESTPKHEGKAMTTGSIRTLVPQNFSEAERLASILAKSDIVPKEMIGKPANILVAIMFGSEIGLPPAQALQNVMVVNGRPSLWGDAVMGKCEASDLLEAWSDQFDEKTMTATFTVKRKGRTPVTRTFSKTDAEKANLWTKAGPWQQYPKRMLFHRARSWALRDTFPDVLKGIRYFEEERDIIDLERQGEGKVYAMPKSTDEPETAPAAEVAKMEPIKGPEWSVEYVAATEVDGNDAFVIRAKSSEGKVEKFYTDRKELFEAAKAAKGTKHTLVLEKEDRKDYFWITAWAVVSADPAK